MVRLVLVKAVLTPRRRTVRTMVTKDDIEWAWDKAAKIRSKNPNLYRRDELGNEIYKPSYGTEGKKGWEIDHRRPVSKGGTDHRRNLRALNSKANADKGDDY